MTKQMDENDRDVSDTYYRKLYHAFCQGERVAQHELYNLCAERLLRYVRRTCIFSDFETAEDCVQNTWQRLFELCKSNALKTEGNFWGWVCSIAMSQAVDQHRYDSRKKRRPDAGFMSLWDDKYAMDIVDNMEKVDASVQNSMFMADPALVYEQEETVRVQQQRQQCFEKAVAELPDKQREAFQLWALNKYSLNEIAKMLNENAETVKSRIRFAKDKLKQALLNNGGDEAPEALIP